MFTAVINWLYGKPSARRNYACDKHGTISTVLRFEPGTTAKRYCAECFRETLREVKVTND